MAKTLYLHGSQAGPYGDKTEHLERHRHAVVGRPRLPYPLHGRQEPEPTSTTAPVANSAS